MLRFWRREEKVAAPPASLPAGKRIYAVGDIHGRIDLLRMMLAKITQDASSADLSKQIIFVGDYVDRGMDSSGVIDLLLQDPPPGFAPSIFLKGNHEDAMLQFLKQPAAGQQWLSFGGLATLYSYGVPVQDRSLTEERLSEAAEAFKEKLPPAHQRFFGGLKMSASEGDYFFVHAGIRPGVPLDRQSDSDMMWIRDEFLGSTANFGKIVVHGHTISAEPEVLPNRIGIDTGAFATGRLTCLVLEGHRRRFLATGSGSPWADEASHDNGNS